MTSPEWMQPECNALSNTTIDMIVNTTNLIKNNDELKTSFLEDMIKEIRHINCNCENFKECKDYIEKEIRERIKTY